MLTWIYSMCLIHRLDGILYWLSNCMRMLNMDYDAKLHSFRSLFHLFELCTSPPKTVAIEVSIAHNQRHADQSVITSRDCLAS